MTVKDFSAYEWCRHQVETLRSESYKFQDHYRSVRDEVARLERLCRYVGVSDLAHLEELKVELQQTREVSP